MPELHHMGSPCVIKFPSAATSLQSGIRTAAAEGEAVKSFPCNRACSSPPPSFFPPSWVLHPCLSLEARDLEFTGKKGGDEWKSEALGDAASLTVT